MDNIFALVVLACQKAIGEGKVADAELGDDRLTIAKALLSHEYEHDRIVSFLFFLKNFLYINDVEINRIFDKQIVQLSEKEFDMGVIEIVKKHAREDNTREIIKHLISETEFSDEQASRITGVNVDFIRELRSELEQEKQE